MNLLSTALRRWPLVALLAVLCVGSVSARGQAKDEPDMPGEVLVKLRSTAGLQPLLAKHGLSLVSRFGARPIYRMQVGAGLAPQEVIRRLLLEPEVIARQKLKRRLGAVIGEPLILLRLHVVQQMHKTRIVA